MGNPIRVFILVFFIYCKSLIGQSFHYGGGVGYGITPNGEKHVWGTWLGCDILSDKKLSPYMGGQLIRYVPDNGNMFVPQLQVGIRYMRITGYYGFGTTPSIGVSVGAGYQQFRFEYVYNENIVIIGGGYRLW